MIKENVSSFLETTGIIILRKKYYQVNVHQLDLTNYKYYKQQQR